MRFSFFKRNKYKGTITSINIKLQGSVHALKGMEVNERRFELKIPYKNKIQENPLAGATVEGEQLLKMQKQKDFSIKSIVADPPFKVLSVEPALPLNIKPNDEITIKMSVEAPDHSFNGPLNINFSSENTEVSHIELTKIVLKTKEKSTEIEESAKMFNVPKAQIFTQKIQMYKAMSYGDVINNISVNRPFNIVSTDPKIPFKIDNKESYLLTLYMTTDSEYAGPLEISFG